MTGAPYGGSELRPVDETGAPSQSLVGSSGGSDRSSQKRMMEANFSPPSFFYIAYPRALDYPTTGWTEVTNGRSALSPIEADWPLNIVTVGACSILARSLPCAAWMK